ncbi:MAG: hypothetical protein LUG56_03440 [Lachnospiraceae bacterium]|nr:hypothetical protein [Lachnospiraceae bacterium]
MELGESSRLLESEKDTARMELERLRTKYRETERAIIAKREERMKNYERYVLGEGPFNKDADSGEQLTERLNGLNTQLRAAENEVLRLEKESPVLKYLP